MTPLATYYAATLRLRREAERLLDRLPREKVLAVFGESVALATDRLFAAISNYDGTSAHADEIFCSLAQKREDPTRALLLQAAEDLDLRVRPDVETETLAAQVAARVRQLHGREFVLP